MKEKTTNHLIRNLSAICSFLIVLSGLEGASPIPGLSPVAWFDAKDASTITGSAPITAWNDKSGNNRHATKTASNSAPALNATGGPGNSPVVQIRRSGGDDFLAVGGSGFIAREHYYVFRSADAKRDATERTMR